MRISVELKEGSFKVEEIMCQFSKRQWLDREKNKLSNWGWLEWAKKILTHSKREEAYEKKRKSSPKFQEEAGGWGTKNEITHPFQRRGRFGNFWDIGPTNVFHVVHTSHGVANDSFLCSHCVSQVPYGSQVFPNNIILYPKSCGLKVYCCKLSK